MGKKQRERFTLDREICNDLRGIAILAVIAGHIFGGQFGLMDSHITGILGTGAVNVFLILSGYGLFCSYKKSGLAGRVYWGKKIEKVMLPYAAVTLLYYVCVFRANGVVLSPEQVFANIIGLDFQRGIDGTMWYISFLLIWYVLFFAVFYFDYPVVLKVFLIYLCGAVFRSTVYKDLFLDCNWQFSVNADAFPTGVMLGYVLDLLNRFVPQDRVRAIGKGWKIVLCLVCGVVLVLGIFQKIQLSYLYYGLLEMGMFYFLMDLVGKTTPVLDWLGANSYFLYLIEGKLIGLVGRLQMLNENAMLYLGVYAVCIFLLTELWSRGWKKTMELCRRLDL